MEKELTDTGPNLIHDSKLSCGNRDSSADNKQDKQSHPVDAYLLKVMSTYTNTEVMYMVVEGSAMVNTTVDDSCALIRFIRLGIKPVRLLIFLMAS